MDKREDQIADWKERKRPVDDMLADHDLGLYRQLGRTGSAFVARMRALSARLGRYISAASKR